MAGSILFKNDLLQLVRSGVKTQTSRLTSPIIPYTANLLHCKEVPKGDHAVQECLFAVGSEQLAVRTHYYPEQVVRVCEAWKCIRRNDWTRNLYIGFRDGQVIPIFFEDQARYAKFQKYYGRSGWQSPYFLPKEATRLYIQVEYCYIRRLSSLTEREIYAEGCPIIKQGSERVWMNSTWDSCLSSKQPSVDAVSTNDPWVETIIFHKFFDKAKNQ